MSRLDNIIARNTPPPWYRDKVVRAVIVFFTIVVVIGLAVCTDLGKPDAPPGNAAGSAVRERPTRVDGIGIGRPKSTR